MRTVRRIAAALVIALHAFAAPVSAAPPAASEYDLKAAFLFNFAKFVDWPPESLQGVDALYVCVLGEDPFGDVLDRAFAGKTVHDRPLIIRRLTRVDQIHGCHILFVSGAAERRLGELTRTSGPLLTIGETDQFLRHGGVVAFEMEENRLRFEINADAADEAGLKISSQLMKLATRIIRSDS